MASENSEISSRATTSKLQIYLFQNHLQKLIAPSRSTSSYRFAPKISPPSAVTRTRTRRVTNRVPMTRIWDPSLFWPASLTRMTSTLGHYCLLLMSTNPKKKKKKGHFILCFACIFLLFIFVCNIPKKKKKIEFQNSKKESGIYFFILSSWVEIEPSHRATELRSRTKTISRSEPLSHWVMIQAIEPWSVQAKL
jgi:hypothetical protein